MGGNPIRPRGLSSDQPDNNNEQDQIEEIIARSVSREELAFRSFLRIYEMSNPRPTFGWYVTASAIAMIALMLVAALRTAFSFGLSAFTSLNDFLKGSLSPDFILILSGIEAVCAVLGIEGFIVTTGMKDGMQKSEQELGAPRAIAAYILLIVSCVAGLFQNSALIGNVGVTQTVEIALMVITGLGVPISLIFASPYLGLMLNFQSIQEKNWPLAARQQFESSKERKLARRDLMAAQQPVVHHQVEQHERLELPATKEIVDWYRQANNVQPGDRLSAAEIADAYFNSIKKRPSDSEFALLAGAIRINLRGERYLQ